MNQIKNLSRRQFLAGSASGLTLAFLLPLSSRKALASQNSPASALTAFLNLNPEGKVTFYNPFIEMGQGTYTSIPMLVAEEMDIDLDSIEVTQAPHGDQYKTMFGGTQRYTGGSRSVRSSYELMRTVGSAARAMLLQAGAQALDVPLAELDTDNGQVRHKISGRKLSYGQLAEIAATLPVPESPPLKIESDFRYIGKPVKRKDTLAKTDGTAEFGIDVKVPGMLYAAVKRNPVYGETISSVDADAVQSMRGVIAVERIPQGVAVVADSYWHAKLALDNLPVSYAKSDNRSFSSEGLAREMRARADEPGLTAEDQGDIENAFEKAADKIEATYEVPFLAHTTMEPMNCTAHVTSSQCELWAPNQGVDFFAQLAAKITGLPLDKITVHTPYLGGGFGRRFYQDYAEQALVLAKKIGQPVKVIWSREEDLQQDFFRPMTVVKHRAALDKSKHITAWHISLTGEGPAGRLFPLKPGQADNSVVEGAIHQPYAIANKRVDWIKHTHQIPIGFWRSVGHSFNGFITESFIDEMAYSAGVEPLVFRSELLNSSPRYLKVLQTATQLASYQAGVIETDAMRYAYGIALHESFGSIVAQVAKVSIEREQPKIHKIWCSIDCGKVVNPDTIEAQMQSGISTGLSQLLLEEVTFKEGKAVQSNFHDYPILPANLMPEIEVAILESDAEIGGVGEPGTPPAAAAVCNALFKLSGTRIRKLPIKEMTFVEARENG